MTDCCYLVHLFSALFKSKKALLLNNLTLARQITKRKKKNFGQAHGIFAWTLGCGTRKWVPFWMAPAHGGGIAQAAKAHQPRAWHVSAPQAHDAYGTCPGPPPTCHRMPPSHRVPLPYRVPPSRRPANRTSPPRQHPPLRAMPATAPIGPPPPPIACHQPATACHHMNNIYTNQCKSFLWLIFREARVWLDMLNKKILLEVFGG